MPNGYVANNATCEVGCNTLDGSVRKQAAQAFYRINNNTLDSRLFVHSTLSPSAGVWQLANRDAPLRAFARVANYRALSSGAAAVFVFWYILDTGAIFEARFEANAAGALQACVLRLCACVFVVCVLAFAFFFVFQVSNQPQTRPKQ